MSARSTVVTAAYLLVACSGGDSSTAPVSRLSTVSIAPGGQAILVGQSLQLSASPRDQSGNAIAATVTWNSASNAVATVDGNGLVRGIAPGTTTIGALAVQGANNAASSVQIVVLAPPVLTTVEVSAAKSTTLFLGTISQFVASARDQRGNPISASVAWRSSNEAVATVNASGLVTSVGVGASTITATATSGAAVVAANLPITVSTDAPMLSTVVISPAETTVEQGESLQLQAATRDQYGDPVAASVAWTTSSAAVALVSASGLVSGAAPGTATITATASLGGATAAKSVVLTVTPPFPLAADVVTSGNTFVPSTVEIKRSGSVTWTFTANHNVVFDAVAGAPQGISDRSSGSVARQFNTPGTFGYVCAIHSGMTGTVIVH